MKRKQFLYTALGTASVAALGYCSNQPIRWRMATSWSEQHNIIFKTVEDLCQSISTMTKGQFEITPYHAGKIVPSLEVLDAVQARTVECGHTASYYYYYKDYNKDKNFALAFATSVPFGLNAQWQNAWLYEGGGLEAIQEIYDANFGIINFPAGNTGGQMGGWFQREVNTVEKLKDVKMRIPGLGGEVMRSLGVGVFDLPYNEIIPALEKGDINAAEWIGPYDDKKLGLNTKADFYYYPGWWEPGTTFDVLINLEEWGKLPEEYQEIFKVAAFQANTKMLAKYDALNLKALQEIIEGGTQFHEFDPAILEAAHAKTIELYDAEASRDKKFKEFYEKWKKFRRKIYQWHKYNE